MAIHWQIKFRSLRTNELYTVSVHDDEYYGNPVQLAGAADPFVTDEDDDDDIFTPLRTQSGYLRIVDTGTDMDGNPFDWHDMQAVNDLSRRIVLTDSSGAVRWQGFMQAQQFESRFGTPQEREFPVQCILSTLSCRTVNPDLPQFHNMAFLIWQAFTPLTSYDTGIISRYIFQGGETNVTNWLGANVDWQNFVNDDTDKLTGKYDNMELLEEVCKFWGWTCRTDGDTVVFQKPGDADNDNYISMSYYQLYNIAHGLATDMSSEYSTDYVPNSDIYADDESETSYVHGVSRAIVSSGGNEPDSDVIALLPDGVHNGLCNDFKYYVIPTIGAFPASGYPSPLLTGTSTNNNFCVVSLSKSVQRDDVLLDKTSDSVDAIMFDGAYSSTPYASVETVFSHGFYDRYADTWKASNTPSGFCIKLNTYRKYELYEDADSNGVGNKSLYLRLGIGEDRSSALWYNGTSWVSSQSEFVVTIGNKGEETYVVERNGEGGKLKKWIRCTHENLRGKIFLDFLGSKNMPTENDQMQFQIGDFRLEFHRKVRSDTSSKRNTKEGREYTADNSSMRRDEWTRDCIFSSFNDSSFDLSLIFDDEGIPIETVSYNGGNAHPEQHLADAVARYYSVSHEKQLLHLRADCQAYVGRVLVSIDGLRATDTVNGLVPIAISRDWRDDVIRVTLMDKGS